MKTSSFTVTLALKIGIVIVLLLMGSGPSLAASTLRQSEGANRGVNRVADASGAIRPGFDAYSLPANDDESTVDPVSLGFAVNFYGLPFSSLYVNNNGNVTFDGGLYQYTPDDLTSTGRQIIAPFWADVDTRGSGLVTYGTGSVDNRPAFGVNWINVGYYSYKVDKLNSFQLIIIDRSDIAVGDFDFEFNYDKVQWETGDYSGGTNGLGGNSARAGYSNGTGKPGTSFELRGSAMPGSFLDTNSVILYRILDCDNAVSITKKWDCHLRQPRVC